ncbi:MAG: hypothetical protein OXG53_10335 [Chloroflexi bacterium]|nr:hypothetical protein [Chloroflexota bacterium]
MPGGGKAIADVGKGETLENAVIGTMFHVSLPLPANVIFRQWMDAVRAVAYAVGKARFVGMVTRIWVDGVNGWSRDFLEFHVGTFVPAMVNCLEDVSIERDRSQ